MVEDQVLALQAAGHDVTLIGCETDELSGPLYPLTTAVNVLTSRGFDPTGEIESWNPDIVHVHNLHPNFGTRWIRKMRIPVALSVHNYRAFCSNGLLFRSGEICRKCPESGHLHGVGHACYRGSRIATIPLALSRPAFVRDVLEAVSAVVTTSELSDEVVRQLSRNTIRTDMIPNFGSDASTPVLKPAQHRRWLALGRFSPEKGFLELLDEWPLGEELTLIGDGPLANEVREKASQLGINVLKALPIEKMRRHLAEATGLIFPSRWYEADPQVVVESMRLGIPVVALEVNSAAFTIESTGAGVVYGRQRPLAGALAEVTSNRERMSLLAREAYETRWTRGAWLAAIEDLYQRLVVAHG